MAKKLSMTASAKQFADAMGNAINQISIVTQCVKACKGHFGGDVAPKEDVADFANKVAEYREWSESSVKSRKSEVSAVVKAYTRLESACKAVAEKTDSFTWHNAVKVARIINRMPKASDAMVVREFFESKPANQLNPKDKALKALKSFMDVSTTAKDVVAIQTAVQKLLDSKNIEL